MPNRLIDEKSPYLLQHAYNPVEWYPWGEEAFNKALSEDKPIFLSIGYSTCHWCHVMERESFEDHEVAGLMNDTFVSIKVDREERPDLDNIYMTVSQMLTGSGGWPLTIIMTPDKNPFFAGTYIPKESRFGRKGMMELIPLFKEAWATRRNDAVESANEIFNALQGMENEIPGGDLGSTILAEAYHELSKRFDKVHGGLGSAPKFPSPHNLYFMLRYWKRTDDNDALHIVEKTLSGMRQGGIYDQIGFGFHRYSTDREWLVPHFEKMLYDQALLAIAYLEAYQATGKSIYADTAREIFEYVMRDMTDPEGGFYSAEDADSEGVEGKFYVWEMEEIEKHFDIEDVGLIKKIYNVEVAGNYKDEATGRNTGTNILHLKDFLQKVAEDLGITAGELEERADRVREKLFNIREKRIHPYKDDKILVDWNGLMISAFARGAQILNNAGYLKVARKAAGFIMNNLYHPDKGLVHRYRDGQAGITANVDDYAFLVWSLLELYEASFDSDYLSSAIELNQYLLKHFWDEKRGGFFFTPDDGEELIIRTRESNDGAVPSGNSVAMLNLLRLSRFTGDHDLEKRAGEIERAFSNTVKQYPLGYTMFLTGIDFGIGPSYEVVIAGNSDAPDTTVMLQTLRNIFIPNKVIVMRPTEIESPPIDDLAEFVKHHLSIEGKATAYVCQNFACNSPTTDTDKMIEYMNQRSAISPANP